MTAHNLSRNAPDRMDLRFSGEPFHPILVSFPIAYFTAAFLTDLAYWQTAAWLWGTFSDWLHMRRLGGGVRLAVCGPAGCDKRGGKPTFRCGATLLGPPQRQSLSPPIRIAKVVAWGMETPTVPHGLQVQALATGFEHPRSLYVLPNGDVLVVEGNGPESPIHRPKDLVTGWVQWFPGPKGKGGTRITLLRATKGIGTPVC